MDATNELAALRSELHAMRLELDQLKSSRSALQQPNEQPPTSEVPDTVTRRHWMKAAAAAAVGGTAVALGSAQPAAAVSTFQIGSTTNSDSARTEANHTGTTGGGVSFLFNNQSGFGGSLAQHPAVLGAYSGTAARPSGIYGFSGAGSGSAYGVVGVGNSPQGAGVFGESNVAAGTGVRGKGGSAGNGVTATGRNGVAATGVDYGVIATGQQGAIFIPPTDPVAPPLRGNSASPGALDTQRTDDTLGTSSLWFCVNGPGEWRKLAGEDTAGTLHAITPRRVYDSRAAAPAPGKMTAGTNRVVSVADGRDLATGAVTVANVVPAGARAIAYNLTLDATEGGGFLSVNPGNVTTFAASSINWSATGQIIANAGIVAIAFDRTIKVFCGPGATHFVIDVTGYYL